MAASGIHARAVHDESEGYYLNLASPQPFVFVNWLDETGAGVPRSVTVSYNEAARMMDGGARVDGVPMPAEWIPCSSTTSRSTTSPSQEEAHPPSVVQGARRDDR